ncbi:hypothetical protein JCM8547_004919 [Rhodosporidiobolus lusitaniae]
MAAAPPAIYKACYSGVPVYEMPCQGVAVMRRKSDAWLNATQILKVAGFDKPQRTRVLEREVQKGTHEKVQGGYGKYQGTWVPMERGIALARQYGVDRLLQPIIDYIPTADSPPLAPKHITAAPTRPRKKHDIAHDMEAMPTPPPKSARQNKSAAARRMAAMVDLDDEYDREQSPQRSAKGTELSRTPSPQMDDDDGEYGAPTKKRKTGHNQHAQQLVQDDSMAFVGQQQQQMGGLGPLRYARMILDYFVSESTQVPQFLVTPPSDFDPNVVIDDDGHTALHWACAMGRIRIVKLLLTAGADIFRANSMGQTALMRSVMFTNNYDLRKFPELFELLHRSTINIDRNDRTVFHYIVDIALHKNKTHAARYYMETVLNRLVDYPDEVADILNFQDEEGETALTLAARARSKRLVKILLENGADPRVANRDGKTAEDYILEDERFREQDAANGAPGFDAPSSAAGNGLLPHPSAPYTNGTAPHAPTPALAAAAAAGPFASSSTSSSAAHPHAPSSTRLFTSSTAQLVANEVIPDISNLLSTLATSFDAELLDKERELELAVSEAERTEKEIADARREVELLQQRAGQRAEELRAQEERLSVELDQKRGKRFRLGWEKWLRDEDSREQGYEQEGGGGAAGPEGPQSDLDAYRELVEHVPGDAEERAEALRARIDQFKEERARLFEGLREKQAERGMGSRMGVYRQLVALGCGVPLDQVDDVIDALVENLEGGPMEG